MQLVDYRVVDGQIEGHLQAKMLIVSACCNVYVVLCGAASCVIGESAIVALLSKMIASAAIHMRYNFYYNSVVIGYM